jgi:hypothetical protein
MRLRFLRRDRAEVASRPASKVMTPPSPNRVNDWRQDLKRKLRKRGDDEDDCDSSDDEEDDDEKDKSISSSSSAKPTKTKSKCSRLPPPPTGLPLQPPPPPSGLPTTTFAGGIQQSALPISVSAFPALSTGVSVAATATTLSLITPAITQPLLPSGTRKGGSDPQAVKASGHHSLSPHAKTALIAFGIISKIYQPLIIAPD